MNKNQNLIKLHLITVQIVETVEEVISHERSDIISQYENPRSKTMKIAVKDGNNLGIVTVPIEHILYIDVIFLKEDELRDYMEASCQYGNYHLVMHLRNCPFCSHRFYQLSVDDNGKNYL